MCGAVNPLIERFVILSGAKDPSGAAHAVAPYESPTGFFTAFRMTILAPVSSAAEIQPQIRRAWAKGPPSIPWSRKTIMR